MPLNGKQRRHLRALGHALDPVVQVGKLGLSESLVRALDEALTRHELVKVRIGGECPVDRHTLSEELASATASELAQLLGRTALYYRRHPKKPRIVLPE
ncbi:MAG: ribosome assembly RNA-binding protein YhbY [Polyangiaceae bacterium]|nr:ribosome assembly RNA-binding protein YhbY [Polyangiaceae bacterium]